MKQEEEQYHPITIQQIQDLTAMYDDYLFVVRQYERLRQIFSDMQLASYQMEEMYSGGQPYFPWHVSLLNKSEQQHFSDFVGEKIHDNTGKAYITLDHINPAENYGEPLSYVAQPYRVSTLRMPLPSPIERYTIVYPENGTLKNTEFLIDGRYKATYIHDVAEDKLLDESINDAKMYTEFRILVRLIENMGKHKDNLTKQKFSQIALSVYAAEVTETGENSILDILGSFAEKVQSICRKRYHVHESREALQLAEEEGLIHSAEDFQDYVNIRNLMQHQWDTLDELGYFRAKKYNKYSNVRAQYVKSYLKLCDKPPMQRVKAYIDVLHQMQQVINKINPNRMIRGVSESNTKFIGRVKAFSQQNPSEVLFVELNFPLDSDRYKRLHKTLHKIVPQAYIVDDYEQHDGKRAQLEADYQRRSSFLNGYHMAECLIMTYCITRGQDLMGPEAWEYAKNQGVISAQEFGVWKQYAKLRNLLSHEYFNEYLRQYLLKIEKQYMNDLGIIMDRFYDTHPDIEWIKKGVYEYTHKDGLVVRLDFENRKVSYPQKENKRSLRIQGKIDLSNIPQGRGQDKKIEEEVYPSGLQYVIFDKKIKKVKLPTGVCINLDKQNISWDGGTFLYMNAEKFNVLHTGKSKILTDKNYRVTEYMVANHKNNFSRGDNLLVDHHHNVMIDSLGRLSVFRYRKSSGQIVQTRLGRTKSGQIVISFDDGIEVLQDGKNITVWCKSVGLNFANRQEFAALYEGGTMPPPALNRSGNSR